MQQLLACFFLVLLFGCASSMVRVKKCIPRYTDPLDHQVVQECEKAD